MRESQVLTAVRAVEALESADTVYSPGGTPCVVTGVLATARGCWITVRSVAIGEPVEGIERSPVAGDDDAGEWGRASVDQFTRVIER
jgi:hypothetical protein